MLIVERHKKLIELLRQRKAAELDELARELSVSSSTVRRDLESLEQQGIVKRTHGGAIYQDTADAAQASEPMAARMQERAAAKQAIGRYAAQLVQPHMTLLLDGGSTVVHAAQLIEARPIQVVTNSLVIANLFADDDQVELLVVGGNLYGRTGVLVGPIATGCLADLHADLLLFSLAGLYEGAGFNINLTMAQVEQVMMQQATRSMMLMDSSKFGRKSLVRVCGVEDVERIVTDAEVDETWRAALGERLVVTEA